MEQGKKKTPKLRKRSLVDKVSTMPNPDSIKWAGSQYSLLSAVLLWTMWLCRLASPLQWLKLFYRWLRKKHQEKKRKKALKQHVHGETAGKLVDNGSGRINVPPMLCEIYFLLWLAFFTLCYLGILPAEAVLSRGLAWVYLFESVVWVLYYTIFRRFFEARYSIYHELEYLSVLLLVIPTQGLCFALLYRRSFLQMLAGLLGAGSDGTPFPVLLLGALFAAIVISMIISAFPTEAVKKHTPQTKMFVIGNGDVVRQRLGPALEKSGTDPERSLFLLDITDRDRSRKDFDEAEPVPRICTLIGDNVDHNSVVWIETPARTHPGYLKKLLDTQAPLIVVEKPMAVTTEQLAGMEELLRDDAKRSRIFFLSYYLLEKALPLYYLLCREPVYEKYLRMDDRLSLTDWRVRLGQLHTLEVEISEQRETRPSVKENGGQWLETFFHNVVLASLFCGLPDRWNICEPLHRSEDRSELYAEENGTRIHLLQRKSENQERTRCARLCFENGSIDMDMDSQSLEIRFVDVAKVCHIWVADQWTRQRYSILVDLVRRVQSGECSAAQVDGLYNQLAVNRWLAEQLEKDSEASGQPVV